jgi:hypothetical protein
MKKFIAILFVAMVAGSSATLVANANAEPREEALRRWCMWYFC